jgi:ATP-dependent helicase/nuclease subunit B
MSTYFLRRFAHELIQNHPDDLSRVTVVLPTTRARLFLMKYLHELKGGTFWAPECVILPVWVRSILPGRIGGELEMIAAMYEQYRGVVGGSESFETFLGWQGIAMRDFNDVDSSLAPASKVFSDLRNIREIENWDPEAWSFNRTPLSATQENFLRFWNQLGELYSAFDTWQNENECRTYSKAVRFLAENESAILKTSEADCIYFVGLGSYSAAERRLIKLAGQHWNVKMVWDLDHYYYDNSNHEAGAFARKWREVIDVDSIASSLDQHSMKATVVKCGTSISQVMRAAEILAEFSAPELDNTCVVINDESALEPLLSAIADIGSEVNLAIGKPLQQTNLSRIAEELFVVRSLHMRKGKIYHKHFVQWLQVIRASGFESKICDQIREEIVAKNLAQITPDQLATWQTQFPALNALFGALKGESSPFEAVSMLYEFMQRYESADDFAEVARVKMLGVIEDLLELLQRYEYMNQDQLLLKLYQLVIGRMKMQYTGEPIQGLQLLSLSETRALDFERVLFLGANEEYFPGERFEQSFIPFDLRNFYKLPMPEDADAIHSYTHYRLLHHAREVYYLYSTVVSDGKSAEPSRYITQLMTELKQANSSLTWIEEVVGTTESIGFREGAVSSDFVKERLRSLFEAGISPSAINKLVGCSLDFYYRYIARLGEEKEVDESMSSSKFGEIVHKVLEDFYKPFVGSYPSKHDFSDLKNSLAHRVMTVAAELYGGRSLDSGIDHLSIRIANDMLEKYIAEESTIALDSDGISMMRQVKFVEDNVSRKFEVEIDGEPFAFMLRGKIDRADVVAGVLQVIDYKTGKIGADKTAFKGEFELLFKDAKYSKFLQLLMYIMMTRDKQQPVPIASFYSMRENGGSFVHAQDLSSLEIDHDFVDRAEQALGRFLHELYNRETFEHNRSAKYCEYCLVTG